VAVITSDHPFLDKHRDKIVGVLSCFDRLIFRGYLPLSYPRGMEGFLYRQNILFKDFKHYAPKVAERLKQHVRSLVEETGGLFRHLPRKERMEEEARRLAQEKGITAGIICGFSCLETCRTYRLQYGEGRPRLKKDFRRCTVLYVYLFEPALGLIHVKLETWFPLTMQVYVNGHELLARQLDEAGIDYVLADNAFAELSDWRAAAKLAARIVKRNWPRLLGRLAKRFNPLLEEDLQGLEYYWVTDQAEYATDVVFKDEQTLQSLYPRLVEHASLCLGTEDVLRFLGRRLSVHLKGEVETRRVRRVEGVCVKHQHESNRLKMYDKGGRILRIETVINQPRAFRVRRWRTRQGSKELAWQPLCKGVAWLWRYAEVAGAANHRYLEALAVVEDTSRARTLLDQATRPAKWGKQRKRALQPMSPEDQALFVSVLRGQHRLHGLRNRELTEQLYPKPTKDPVERRRRCGRVTRLIQLLRAHGLLAKVPRSRRYRITSKGELLMSAAIYVRYKHLPNELSEAA
jgi:hypothetical protein